MTTTNEMFMKEALKEARKAYAKGEIPVGAVVVRDEKIIARAHNNRAQKRDIFSHAELTALKKAAKKIGDWRLNGCDLYVTLEPCAMCAGAAVNARIRKIYFGANESKNGCCGSVLDIPKLFVLNHKTQAEGGILWEECSFLLKDFFAQRRLQNKQEDS